MIPRFDCWDRQAERYLQFRPLRNGCKSGCHQPKLALQSAYPRLVVANDKLVKG